MGGKNSIALSLCCGRGKESDDTAFVQFVKYVTHLDTLSDALKSYVRGEQLQRVGGMRLMKTDCRKKAVVLLGGSGLE